MFILYLCLFFNSFLNKLKRLDKISPKLKNKTKKVYCFMVILHILTYQLGEIGGLETHSKRKKLRL